MFDGLYQNETDRALSAEVERPRPTPKKPPGFFTGMGTALTSGPTQGALETGRAVVNVLSEFGKAAAFAQGATKEESIDRMFTEEDPNAAELGRLAKKYDPSPETSSTAAQVVHQFGRIGAKVVGAAALAGPAAPLVVGADEGITEGLKLSDKGVDPATAAQAGLVHGVATAASVALPLAGKTIGQTLGLAVAGGPVSFMAEQAGIKAILEGADYESQAAEYDPFDVTGLVLSTAAPLLFGAGAHVARAARAARNTPTVTPAAAIPDDVVDAARVDLLNQHDLALVRGTGPEAQQAHTEGRAIAEERMERGEPAVETGQRGIERESGPAAIVETAEPAPVRAEPVSREAETAPPEVQQAEAAVAARGDFEIEMDDGTRVMASEALAEAKRLTVEAETEGKGFMAAAECMLEVGS